MPPNPNKFPPQAELENGDMFAVPIPVPAESVDAAPLRCFVFNEAYAPVIAKALVRLTYHDAWTGTDADIQRATRQFEHLVGLALSGDCP